MSAPTESINTEPVQDYLEVDDPIPGQNYVCMSFVSPEELIADRNLFNVHAFLKTVAKNYDLDETTVQDKFKDFMFVNESKLDEEYGKKTEFRTSMRGLKIRGVYDTISEAQRRAKLLQKTDPNFNVFVGQVGYWLPWDPEPHKVSKQEYAEKELNELIHKYEENQEARKVAFNKRVEREMAEAKKKSDAVKKANADAKQSLKDAETAQEATDAQSENVLDQVMDQSDAWSQRQSESQTQTPLNSSNDTDTKDKTD